MCSEPTKVARAAAQRLGAPGRERGVAAHRVLELGAVRLDGERRAGGGADRAAEEDVVREDDVGGKQGADRGGVRLDPGVELARVQSCRRRTS